MKLNIANWYINCDGADGRGGTNTKLDINSAGLWGIDDSIIGFLVYKVLFITCYWSFWGSNINYYPVEFVKGILASSGVGKWVWVVVVVNS